MSLLAALRLLARATRRGPSSPARSNRRTRLWVERLEEREVLYSVTGNAWPHANLITISFMPDGTSLGGTVTNNLNASFNANPYLNQAGAANWKSQVLKAAQVWAQQANINFAVVNDNGAASGSGLYQQGDPGFGDIRVGGYNFGNTALASAYQPPAANNYSIAGDIVFNTGQTWREGTTYDLFTVAMHEFGHALGLDHSTTSTANVMYPSYTTVKSGLSADDISGIKAIYGANTADAFDAAAANGTIATASNVNSYINTTTLTALVSGVDITTTSDVDTYAFQAPAGTGGTVKVQVQSAGLSLLAPKVTVYAANGTTVLASASGLNQYGTTLTVSVSGVAAGQTYYVQVDGADATAFGTGAYALALNFGTGATPTAASPVTTAANGSPLSGSGGCADGCAKGDTLLNAVPTITGITPDTGSSSSDGITNARNISLRGAAPENNTVQIFLNQWDPCTGTYKPTLIGTTTTGGSTAWTFNYTGTTLADGTYIFTANAVDASGNVSGMSATFNVTIDTAVPAAPTVLGFSPDTGVIGDGITNAKVPTISGAAAPFTSVSIYRTNSSGTKLTGTVPATAAGLWSFTEPAGLADGTYTYTATATDVAGNVSPASGPLSVTIDTQAPANPSITGISPDTGNAGDRITTAKDVFIQGKATAGVSVSVYFQNGPLLGTVTADGTGAWQFYPGTLADGTYNFTAQASDVAGNTSGMSGASKVVIETVPTPVIAGVAETFNKGVGTLTVSGTAAAGNHVQIQLNGAALATVSADSNGRWSYAYTPASLPNGTYSFGATATDGANCASDPSAPLNLVLGLGAPYVSAPSLTTSSIIGTGSGGVPITTATPTLTGTATPGSTVTIVDGNTVLGTAVADANGLWTFTTPTLAKGTHSIRVFDTDLFGNSSLLSAALALQV
jgi:hypothetical protein